MKTNPQSMFYKAAPFTKLQEKMCGLSALPWQPNSMLQVGAGEDSFFFFYLPSGPDHLACECQEEELPHLYRLCVGASANYLLGWLL